MPSDSSFTITGDKEMAAKLTALAKRFPLEIAGALNLEAERIMTDSKENHVPVDFGTLKNSGHVDPPVIRGRDISVRLAYGGAAAPYAEAVHEHDSVHSPPTWRGRSIQFSPTGHGPKYLERPMMGAVRNMDERLADSLRDDFGKDI